jgi:hypothetical protein
LGSARASTATARVRPALVHLPTAHPATPPAPCRSYITRSASLRAPMASMASMVGAQGVNRTVRRVRVASPRTASAARRVNLTSKALRAWQAAAQGSTPTLTQFVRPATIAAARAVAAAPLIVQGARHMLHTYTAASALPSVQRASTQIVPRRVPRATVAAQRAAVGAQRTVSLVRPACPTSLTVRARAEAATRTMACARKLTSAQMAQTTAPLRPFARTRRAHLAAHARQATPATGSRARILMNAP